MDDLVRWLGEQLDEDERTVMHAQTPEVSKSETPETWIATPINDDPDSGWQVLYHALRIVPTGEPTVDTYTVVTDGQVARGADHPVGLDRFMAEYIAAHDPARVLREINAKRQIIGEHKPARPEYLPHRELGCRTCSTAQAWDEKANEANCLTLRLLALPYEDRPGYREEWRP